MAPSLRETLIAEINDHQRQFDRSLLELGDTVATTRKSIDESRALMAKIDALIAKR